MASTMNDMWFMVPEECKCTSSYTPIEWFLLALKTILNNTSRIRPPQHTSNELGEVADTYKSGFPVIQETTEVFEQKFYHGAESMLAKTMHLVSEVVEMLHQPLAEYDSTPSDHVTHQKRYLPRGSLLALIGGYCYADYREYITLHIGFRLVQKSRLLDPKRILG